MEVNFQLQPIDGEIIVVEDDPLLREIMAEILADVGAHCVAFPNAEDALVYMLGSGTKCSLVIADHGLPGQLQGAEFVSMVHSRWAEIPAIVTSGWTDHFIGLPPNTRFLPKPWPVDGLVKAVAELLQPGVPVNEKPPPPKDEA